MSDIDSAVSRKCLIPADIERAIVAEHYFTAKQAMLALGHPTNEDFGRLSVCILMLRNGTKIVGVNHGAIDPEQHDPARGLDDARKNARDQVWQLLGYELRSKLATQQA